MRVLQVMAGADHGGAETFFVDLVTALHRDGLDQKVVIRRNPARAALLREAGIEPLELPFGGVLDLITRPRLGRILREQRPHILQSWMNRATRFVSRPEAAPPFVHVGWLGGFYKPANFVRCDHVVGVTEAIRDHLVEGGFAPERAHYLPTFAPLERAEPVSRASLDTPEDAPLFLALGRLHEKKAFDILIRALAGIPHAHLWIAGEGPLRGSLEALIAELDLGGRVHMLGWRQDRGALLAAADVCVMPSRYEPFGTVMIEAWGYGTPLIAAAARGPSGLIRDGEDGLLVPIDDVPALARAMNRMIAEPALAARLAETGRKAFERRFTESVVVRAYRDFYQRIAHS